MMRLLARHIVLKKKKSFFSAKKKKNSLCRCDYHKRKRIVVHYFFVHVLRLCMKYMHEKKKSGLLIKRLERYFDLFLF